jgi:gas vesicle protein
MKRDMIEIGASMLGGLGIGAVVMYLFDPDRGTARRQEISRQAEHLMSDAGDMMRRTSGKARQMRDTASSYLHEVKHRLQNAGASLMQRDESCPVMKAGMVGMPIVGALLLGAGAMFLLDPVSGRRRRARIQDKARHYVNETSETLASTGRHLSNRAKGMMHEAKKSVMSGHESNGGHRLGAVEEHGRPTH